MRALLLVRIDDLIAKAAAQRNQGKKDFLRSCGVAPASYYRWREAMHRTGRWEIPGWLFDLLKYQCGVDLASLFANLASMPWSAWPKRGKLVVFVGSDDAPPQPLSFHRLAERDARTAVSLVDGLHGIIEEHFRVEYVVVSHAMRRDIQGLRVRLRLLLREAACVAAIGSPLVNPVVDILADDYVFGGAAPPFRFRWPMSIHGSFLSDPRADAERIGIIEPDTGNLFLAADPVHAIARAAAQAKEPVPCRDAAILVVDQRKMRWGEPAGDRFELPIIILAMGVAAAGTEAAIRVLFERAGEVDGFLRASRPEGLLFEPVHVTCLKPPATVWDDIEIVSAGFVRQPKPPEGSGERQPRKPKKAKEPGDLKKAEPPKKTEKQSEG